MQPGPWLREAPPLQILARFTGPRCSVPAEAQHSV